MRFIQTSCIVTIGLLACFSLTGQEVKITAFDADFADLYGFSVALDGDFAIVGAPLQNGFGSFNAGAAYIYRRSGAAWIHMAKLTPPWGGNHGDQFGFSVDIAGNYAVVGAINTDHNGKNNAGSAYLYYLSGSTWYHVATLTASDPANDDHFGHSVGVNDIGIVVVGVPDKDDAGISSGCAYLYEPHYSNWIQVAKLLASDAAAGDAFGTDVAIDGIIAVVGSPFNRGVPYMQSGAVYLYQKVPHGWPQLVRLTHNPAGAFDQLGKSVDIEGNTVIAGAPFANNKIGRAFIFSGSGYHWPQTAILNPSDGLSFDKFGSSVGITNGIAVVGSPFHDGAGNDAGAMYIFEQSGSNWSETNKLLTSDAAPGDRFGTQVDIDGSYVIGGAPYQDAGTHDTGASYIFGPSLAAPVCAPFMSLTGTLESGTVMASDFIQVSGIAGTSIQLFLSAGNFVELMPLLEVQPGAEFVITPGGCP